MSKQNLLATLALAATMTYGSLNWAAEGSGGGCRLYADMNNDGKFTKEEFVGNSFLSAKMPITLDGVDISKKQFIMAPNHSRYSKELYQKMESEYQTTGHYDSVRSSFKHYEAVCGSARFPLKFNEQLSKKPMFAFDSNQLDFSLVTSGSDWALFEIDPRVSPSTIQSIPSYDPSTNFDDSRDSVGKEVYVGTDSNKPGEVNSNIKCKISQVGDRGFLVLTCPGIYSHGGPMVSGDMVFFPEESTSKKIGSFAKSGKPTVLGVVTKFVANENENETSVVVETWFPTKSYERMIANHRMASADVGNQ